MRRQHTLERSGERVRASIEQRPTRTFETVEDVARFLRQADAASRVDADAPRRCLDPKQTGELVERAIELLGEEGAPTADLLRVFRINQSRLRGSLLVLEANGRICRTVEHRRDRSRVLQPQIVWRSTRAAGGDGGE